MAKPHGGANPVPTAPARLELDHVDIGYAGAPVLADVSFQVPHGALVAVVGPNGAGKSTLFKALVGLLTVRTGKILIHGELLGGHQDCVAYVPQREEVDWRFPVTVRDVVLMGRYGRRGWLRLTTPQDRAIVDRSLDQMGMAAFAGHPIGSLSGGQQQRVFLARALAQEPHILLMDEPFTGVDITTQDMVLNTLDTLHAQGVTVMVSTHDLGLAAQRFESVLLLNRRLVAYGSPAEVFTPDNLRQAFGRQALMVGGLVVIDECCPPDPE